MRDVALLMSTNCRMPLLFHCNFSIMKFKKIIQMEDLDIF